MPQMFWSRVQLLWLQPRCFVGSKAQVHSCGWPWLAASLHCMQAAVADRSAPGSSLLKDSAVLHPGDTFGELCLLVSWCMTWLYKLASDKVAASRPIFEKSSSTSFRTNTADNTSARQAQKPQLTWFTFCLGVSYRASSGILPLWWHAARWSPV